MLRGGGAVNFVFKMHAFLKSQSTLKDTKNLQSSHIKNDENIDSLIRIM